MLRLTDTKVVEYNNGNLCIIGEIYVDDISELPSPTGIDGYELVQSSVAYVIRSGKVCVIDSSGIWRDTDGNKISEV
ncbi:MAG: hypothetical protein K2J36_08165 [Ruminococcus sp.]|nr:hypothetical protein [Ruminococcus sp.]